MKGLAKSAVFAVLNHDQVLAQGFALLGEGLRHVLRFGRVFQPVGALAVAQFGFDIESALTHLGEQLVEPLVQVADVDGVDHQLRPAQAFGHRLGLRDGLAIADSRQGGLAVFGMGLSSTCCWSAPC